MFVCLIDYLCVLLWVGLLVCLFCLGSVCGVVLSFVLRCLVLCCLFDGLFVRLFD